MHSSAMSISAEASWTGRMPKGQLPGQRGGTDDGGAGCEGCDLERLAPVADDEAPATCDGSGG